jgi:hypothetical protein
VALGGILGPADLVSDVPPGFDRISTGKSAPLLAFWRLGAGALPESLGVYGACQVVASEITLHARLFRNRCSGLKSMDSGCGFFHDSIADFSPKPSKGCLE